MSKTVGGFPSAELLLSTPTDVGPAVTSEAIRVGALAAGGLLALYGLSRGGLLGLGAFAAGGALAVGSRRLSKRSYAARWQGAHAAVTVLADPRALYDRLTVDGLPDVLSFVAGVEVGPGEQRTILLRNGWGMPLRWTVRVVEAEPGRLLVWRSVHESAVPGEGEIRLLPAPGNRGTEIHMKLLLGPPASVLGAIASGEIGNSGEPGVSLQDDLNRFKQLAEAGEIATTEGQSRGRGKRKLQATAKRELPSGLYPHLLEEAQ